MDIEKQIPRRFALTILLPIIFWLFHAVLALAKIVDVYERVEKFFPAIKNVPMWFWSSLLASFSLFFCFVLDRLFRLLRIRALKIRHDEKRIAEFQINNAIAQKRRRIYADLTTISIFFLVFSVFGILSDISQIATAYTSLQRRTAAFSHIPVYIWLGFAAGCIFYLCAAVSIAFLKRRARTIELPRESDAGLSTFANIDGSRLRFRPANSRSDVIDLAKTENYGDMGETDIDQVFRWLKRYPRGNWLAIYDNKIIGGIDIWPLKKTAYEALLNGSIGEEEIDENSLDPRRHTAHGSYWYIASISLAQVWRKSRHRREILGRLVVDAFEQNLKPAILRYPARIIALTWTAEGANIAQKNGFIRRGTRKSELHHQEEPIYEAVFETADDFDRFIVAVKSRLIFKRDTTPSIN